MLAVLDAILPPWRPGGLHGASRPPVQMYFVEAAFLAKCLQPSHPSHQVVQLDRGIRDKKQTLRSKVFDLVEPHLNEQGIIAPGTYGHTIKAIHTQVVSEVVDRLSDNRVLHQRPPLVHPMEKQFSRQTRSVLRQLRSGFCAKLRDYQVLLGRPGDDLCPDCRNDPQTVEHLFNCTSHPTRLAADDIWENPWDAVTFLRSTPTFSFLEDPGPRPPRRRRFRRPPPWPPPLVAGQ